MILYLYALADHRFEVRGITGVEGEPLELLETPSALIAAGWLARAPVLDHDTLAAQDLVVRALHERAEALLPMRFGAVMPDTDAARRALDVIHAILPDRFELVRGREQMTLRVLEDRDEGREGSEGHEGGEGIEGPGTRYLLGRAGRTPPRGVVPLLDALRPVAHATRVEPGRIVGVLATVYQLIDKGSAAAYSQAVASAAARHAALSVRITGPAPPYAFATL